jgi:polyisoprenoid-binding protein YceI
MTMKLIVGAVAVGITFLSASTAGADTFKISKGKVVVVCPLTVGGTFEAKTTAVDGQVSPGTSGALDGRVSVDLNALETGIALRDRHMKETYLETGKRAGFDKAILEQIQIRTVAAGSDQPFKALLTLHGEQLPVAGKVTIREDHGKLRAEAEFPVRLARFGIQSPQYLGVGVTEEVRVRVQFDVLRSGDQQAGIVR